MTPKSFEILAGLLHAGSGLALGADKTYLLESRLAPVLRKHNIDTLDALAARLRPVGLGTMPGGIEQDVIEAMTTNESFFFRDDKPFQHFRAKALPQLLASRPPGAKLRIWSAAASTGQEAYSLAMILDASRAMLGGRSCEIVGTDISREALGRAQQGLYSQFEVQRGLPMQYLVKHFRKEGAQWRISDTLRGMVQFRSLNLLGDLRGLNQCDAVFCRNVLIYFDQPTKAKVLEAIAQQMSADGVLYLGGAETVLGITDVFTAQAGERGVYERSVPALRATPRQSALAETR
jgi:chemotaxis protein methyltransferase CheR